MTTIITVIAIVALVFFVAISVAVFMIWKQETQMRTDSLRGIEASLNEAIDEFSQRRTYPMRSFDEMHEEHFDRRNGKRSFFKKKGLRQAEPEDDVYYGQEDWADREPGIDVTVFRPSEISQKRSEAKNEAPIKQEEPKEPKEQKEPETAAEELQAEPQILREDPEQASGAAAEENENTDNSSNKVDLSFIDIDDLFDLDEILFEGTEHDREADYNTGRSGKKYTAEELETLIKE